MADHLLDIEGRPTTTGNRRAAIAEGMHGNRQISPAGGFVDRPIATLTKRFDGSAEQQYLDEMWVAGPVIDFGDRRLGILERHHERGLEARLFRGPFGDLPLVHCPAIGFGEIAVLQALTTF